MDETPQIDLGEVWQLADRINRFLAGHEGEQRFDGRDLALLEKMGDNLKKIDLRKQLDGMLHGINMLIDRLTTCEGSCGSNATLSAEIDKSQQMLCKIRKLIRRCIKRHTELYLMGQQFDELIANIQIININLPNLDSLKNSPIPRMGCGVMRGIIWLIGNIFFNFRWVITLRAFLVRSCALLSNERNVLEDIKKFDWSWKRVEL